MGMEVVCRRRLWRVLTLLDKDMPDDIKITSDFMDVGWLFPLVWYIMLSTTTHELYQSRRLPC